MSYVNLVIAGAGMLTAISKGRQAKADGQAQSMSLNYQADQEQQAAMQHADIIRRAGSYAVARADAGFAASGVVVGEGSAAEVDRQIDTDSTHDAYVAILDGEKHANALRARAKMAAAGGQAEAQQDYASGAATALSRGGQGYSNWVTMKRAGGA